MKKLVLIAIAAAAPALASTPASAQVIVHPGVHHGGGFHHGGFGRGHVFGGFAFGGFFHQPQYHVQNWQLYGFIAPGPQQRWIRYYDDAYLVDGRGYIHDSRRGVRWDGHGERWDRDQYGIPYYVGRGDFHPDGRDYARVEREGRWSSGWDYSRYGSSCAPAHPCGPAHAGHAGHGTAHVRTYVSPAPAPVAGSCGGYACGSQAGYGYGGYGHGGYGHGCGYGCGTVIVTETTITPGTIVTEEIIEEVIEERTVRRHRPVQRRHRAPAPRRHTPPPVVQPRGERG